MIAPPLNDDDLDVAAPQSPGTHPHRLRLLSFNIQAGITTNRYHHYVTRSWKHVLPFPKRLDTLDRIANLINDFDLVGLQESDAGSLRSGFINQTEYLALQGRFPYWYDQTNRNLGRIAQHSLGVLSRFRPVEITEMKLPGMIPGRGALVVRFGSGHASLVLIILHLALGRRARLRQLASIAEMAGGHRHVIVMGDLNCTSESPEIQWLLESTQLRQPVHGLHTFPSWRPRRNIDHIFVSPSIEVESLAVLNHTISDHLPIAMEVTLPAEVALAIPRHAELMSLATAAAV